MNAISTILVESELKPGLNKRAATAGRVEDLLGRLKSADE